MTRLLILAPFLLVVAACAGSAPSSAYPPVETSEVVVYASEDEIPGEFEIVEFLQPRSRGGYSSKENSQDEMRAQAARLGANGLVLVSENSEVADARIRAAVYQRGSYNRAQYIAIYVPKGTPAEAER